jgi:hypothetical protein
MRDAGMVYQEPGEYASGSSLMQNDGQQRRSGILVKLYQAGIAGPATAALEKEV